MNPNHPILRSQVIDVPEQVVPEEVPDPAVEDLPERA
jgi:hypothetical protein